MKATQSSLTLCDPWTVQFMEFSRPEYWSGFPSPGDLPDPGIKPRSSALLADSLLAELKGIPKYCSRNNQKEYEMKLINRGLEIAVLAGLSIRIFILLLFRTAYSSISLLILIFQGLASGIILIKYTRELSHSRLL